MHGDPALFTMVMTDFILEAERRISLPCVEIRISQYILNQNSNEKGRHVLSDPLCTGVELSEIKGDQEECLESKRLINPVHIGSLKIIQGL